MRAHTVSEDVTDRKGHSDCCRRSCSRAAEQCEHAEPAKQKRRHAQASSSHFVLPSCTSPSVGVTSCMSSSGRGKLTGTRCSVSSSESAAHSRACAASIAGFMPCRPHGWWRGVAGRARRRFGQGQGVHFWGSADEVVLEAQKGFGGTKCQLATAMAWTSSWPRCSVSRRPTMSESRKTDLQNHASGRDDHIAPIGTA